jgi:hypothetical protein
MSWEGSISRRDHPKGSPRTGLGKSIHGEYVIVAIGMIPARSSRSAMDGM